MRGSAEAVVSGRLIPLPLWPTASLGHPDQFTFVYGVQPREPWGCTRPRAFVGDVGSTFARPVFSPYGLHPTLCVGAMGSSPD